ncbi:Small auxin-up RNA protein [Dioscorea alata]|uniref:Small auxin-up RNA protein n=1 Tax=Dioscorea alata TaxID=55571 RepID=A0ACB7VIN4_DIOAL|nr:Small auxin-up RNA protein [Dioscorea alata]
MSTLVKKLLFCGAKSFPSDVELPEGHIWVCVGAENEETQRFELETNYLNHPLFEDLLRLSVQEFGYSYAGALRIACDIDFFLHVLHLLRSSNPRVHYMELNDIMDSFNAGSRQREIGCHHK